MVSDYYEYKEPLSTFKWKINDSIKMIAGYKCQKATTQFAGRKYIAWFTIEIPINDGPYKFNGLPGLIIAIADSKKHYTYTLIASSIIKLREINIFKKNNIQVEKCKLLALKKEMNNNIVRSMNTAGIKIALTPEMKESMNKSARKRNNPIELQCAK
jgi:GLPGLI family protein